MDNEAKNNDEDDLLKEQSSPSPSHDDIGKSCSEDDRDNKINVHKNHIVNNYPTKGKTKRTGCYDAWKYIKRLVGEHPVLYPECVKK